MVANKFDSRIIIDCVGAEKLLGKGDMLFSAAWNPFPVRIQGAFIDDEEIDAVTGYVKKLGPPQYIEDEVFFDDEDTGDFEGEPGNDPLFERALEIVIGQGKASASYIQRRLKVGYNRAARLVEEMEMRGIVGPAQGSKPREVIHVPKSGA
jgi:S-DNA-T family DNA segregation ATPase FtsK/SpoIIIE